MGKHLSTKFVIILSLIVGSNLLCLCKTTKAEADATSSSNNVNAENSETIVQPIKRQNTSSTSISSPKETPNTINVMHSAKNSIVLKNTSITPVKYQQILQLGKSKHLKKTVDEQLNKSPKESKNISVSLNTQKTNMQQQAEQVKPKKFGSICSKPVNIRTGPGREYTIVGKFESINIPVIIKGHHKDWLLIEDVTGMTGWIKDNFATTNKKRRFAIVAENTQICRLPFVTTLGKHNTCNSIYNVEKDSVIRLLHCKNYWCRVKINKLNTGWVQTQYLWGVSENEVL